MANINPFCLYNGPIITGFQLDPAPPGKMTCTARNYFYPDLMGFKEKTLTFASRKNRD